MFFFCFLFFAFVCYSNIVMESATSELCARASGSKLDKNCFYVNIFSPPCGINMFLFFFRMRECADGESEHSPQPSGASCMGSSDVCLVLNPFAHSGL